MTTQPSPALATEAPAEGAAQASKVPHRWRNLAVLTGVTVVDNTEAGLSATLFPTIAAALKLQSSHLGLLAALGKIIAVPAGPAWAWLAGKIGRRKALIATTLAGGVFGIAAGFSQDFVQLLILNTLMSASIIGGSPIANAIIADSFDDSQRGKAAGYFYGFMSLISSFIAPLIALFTGITDGWRFGMWTIGGICLLAGLLVALLLKDPGVGASEKQLADLSGRERLAPKVTVRSVASLFRIPSFSIMMLSRLLSGHLLITIFGIQFLVVERGSPTLSRPSSWCPLDSATLPEPRVAAGSSPSWIGSFPIAAGLPTCRAPRFSSPPSHSSPPNSTTTTSASTARSGP